MSNKQRLAWYTVWSDEHPSHPPERMQEYHQTEAASAWFNAHWCGLGRPDEARVHVRCESGKVLVYDVIVEDIELDLALTPVATDTDGKPLSSEEIQRRADAARAEWEAKKALDRAERATG